MNIKIFRNIKIYHLLSSLWSHPFPHLKCLQSEDFRDLFKTTLSRAQTSPLFLCTLEANLSFISLRVQQENGDLQPCGFIFLSGISKAEICVQELYSGWTVSSSLYDVSDLLCTC